jgi:hypothetical protein
MILLEFRTALRRATKEDLFTGNVNDLRSKQGLKDNITVFYLHPKTKLLYGPKTIFSESDFLEVYAKMAYGLIGIITPIPNVLTNEFLFDMVLREALIEDLKYTARNIKLNCLYYTYANQILLGPFYTDNSTTSEKLEDLVSKKQIFIPNERQHFKIKLAKKAA